MWFFKKLKIDFFLVFLIIIAVFLCYKNYTPKTFLSGWDTLHPEFNLEEYWQRINSVWQEHQGLGAPPSQAHAAEIPRMIVLAILALLFPPDFIRYAYFFLMMILGPAGVYLFLKHTFNHFDHDRGLSSKNQNVNKAAAFLGAFFYLLNLGTMQHFIVPLEMFTTQFGLLGFLFLFAIKFLEEGKKKNLILFSVITILASSMAHTATLWYVYFGGFVLFLITYSGSYALNCHPERQRRISRECEIANKLRDSSLRYTPLRMTAHNSYFSLLTKNSTKNVFKKSLLLIILTLFFNLYWILPNFYYATNYSGELINSKIHRVGSEELYYHNQKYGKISDLLLFKNFLFDWYITNNSGRTQPLLASWGEHLKNPYILIIGYFLSLLSILGIFLSIYKKNIILISFLPISLLASFFLLSDTPGVSIIFDWLRNTTPLIKEVFRFPFTKFSIYLIFCLSLFFAYFHKVFLNKLLLILCQNRLNTSQGTVNFFTSLYLYFFLFVVIVFALPAFYGNFISPIVRVKIPSEYFSLFNWSKKQNKGRILLLPIHDPFGWVYYKWDLPTGPQIYQGAGFAWFGLNQPSLNSEFNRWYPYNEQAYREFFYAVYSQNQTLFQKLLSKYNIKYILLDENVIIPGDESQQKKLFYPEIKKLLSSTENIKLERKFGEKVSLFEFLPNKEKKPVEILTNYKIVQPNYRWNYVDEAYFKNGDYIALPSLDGRTKIVIPENNSFIYPTRNMLTEQEKINQKILSIGENSYQISFEKSQLLENGEIKIPALFNTESEFYAEVYAKKNTDKIIIELKYLLPYIVTDEVYTKQFVFKDQNQRFFSINDKIFSLPSYLSENPTYLGEEILSTQKENDISFYNTDKPEALSTNFPLNLSPYLCSTPQENQIFGAETTVDGFKIYGQRAKVCLEVPLKELVSIENDGALRLSFNYQAEENGRGEFCLFDRDKNKCLFTKNLKPSFSPHVNSFVPIGQKESNSLYLKFIFDTTDSDNIKELLIKNVSFDFAKKNIERPFFAEIPKFELTTEEFKLEGKFPQEKVNITAENIGQEKKDCGFERAKFIDKQFIEDASDVILEYKAIDGSICDSIPLSNLSQNMGYLLAVESQNISGLPLKICFENDKTKVCDLEDRLSKNKTMNVDYFVVPPYSNGYGYNLLLNNYSIGNTPSVNRIKAVRVIPFPYNFFQSIRWESENQKPNSINQLIEFEEKKQSPYLYSIKFKQPFINEVVLALDQAYEKNWRAYIVPDFVDKIPLLQYLCPIFCRELEDHVLVNNWANGWRLRQGYGAQGQISGQNSVVSSQQDTEKLTTDNRLLITVVFLPQYLEFIGFGALFLTLIFIFKLKKSF